MSISSAFCIHTYGGRGLTWIYDHLSLIRFPGYCIVYGVTCFMLPFFSVGLIVKKLIKLVKPPAPRVPLLTPQSALILKGCLHYYAQILPPNKGINLRTCIVCLQASMSVIGLSNFVRATGRKEQTMKLLKDRRYIFCWLMPTS